MSTGEIVYFKRFPWKRYSHYSSAPILVRVGASRFIASLNKLQLKVSIVLCNLQSMPFEKEMRIQTLVLSQKQWNCLPTNPTAIKLWIVVATLSQEIWTKRKHTGLSTQNCSSVWITHWSIVWNRIGEGRDWAQRSNHCWVFHTLIR